MLVSYASLLEVQVECLPVLCLLYIVYRSVDNLKVENKKENDKKN